MVIRTSPIIISNVRLRIVVNENSRILLQEKEKARIRKKDIEVKYITLRK